MQRRRIQALLLDLDGRRGGASTYASWGWLRGWNIR